MYSFLRQLIGLYTGIIRGALAMLGIHAVVSADYNGGTQCKHLDKSFKVLIADDALHSLRYIPHQVNRQSGTAVATATME